ncbi:MAG: hypothetical protein J2O47_06440, partial [Acidimicrobiaceae bacterium]|nr:hypothetical protein [Acidimicrobiaceae bacterium]
VNWGAASVPPNSPPVDHYQVSVGGTMHSTSATSITVNATPWTMETVNVFAVNPVGNGPTVSGSGGAWTRTGTVTCVNSLSGDRAVENDCTTLGGAWTQVADSTPINWINPRGHLGTFSGNFEWLCSTYYTGSVSGDVYAIVGSPSQTACTNALSNYQPPDTPHVIAAVSTSSMGPGSQHICEYQGKTTGTNGTFDTEELVPCGSGAPAGLSGANQVNNFWT